MTELLSLEVYPARFSFEDPWKVPESATRVRLRRSTDGTTPRLETEVAAYYDAESLFVLFRGDDDEVRATYRGHDQPLYEEDVLEVFLAPVTPAEYFELEVNPLGTTLDARIESPRGNRATMRTELSWACADLWAALCRTFLAGGHSHFSTLLSIPFASLGRAKPAPGETWRANFYRIDRAAAGDEYSAWSPTMRSPPDFHVPAAFGELRFKA